jgi:thioredoxin 1
MIIELTDRDFHPAVENSPLPCLVAFWAIWSPSCMVLAKVLEKIDKKLTGKVLVGKVNVDNEIKTANEYDVQNIPTIIVFKKGAEQERIPGAITYNYLMKKIKQYCPRTKSKTKNDKGD